MSKERARRRAEREALAAREAQRRASRALRRRGWTALSARLARLATLTARRRPAARVDSALRRSRSRENGLLLAVFLAGNVVVWLVQSGWGWRLSALVLSVLLWPVLAVLVFDRRPSR